MQEYECLNDLVGSYVNTLLQQLMIHATLPSDFMEDCVRFLNRKVVPAEQIQPFSRLILDGLPKDLDEADFRKELQKVGVGKE